MAVKVIKVDHALAGRYSMEKSNVWTRHGRLKAMDREEW